MSNDIESLSHTKWRCQYHIVFAPKYRRQMIIRVNMVLVIEITHLI